MFQVSKVDLLIKLSSVDQKKPSEFYENHDNISRAMLPSIKKQGLKAYVSEKILSLLSLRHSLSADICIHFHCLTSLRQASHRKMIQSSALRQRLRRFKILTCPLL